MNPTNSAEQTENLAPPDPIELVTIARYDQIIEAGLIKSLLMSAGIPVQLADVHIGNTYGVISNALGGIRLQVPAHNAEEAQQLLEDYTAGRLQLEDTDATTTADVAKPPEPMPTLWQPDWAAALGLIFSPLFPITLHYLNWRQLNNPSQALRALRWLLTTLVILLSLPAYSLWETGSSASSNPLLVLAWITLLLVWYFRQGRVLSQLMAAWIYPKKLMGLAMVIGALCLIGFNMGLGFLSTHALTLPIRVAQLAKQIPVPEKIDEITRRTAVSSDGSTLIISKPAPAGLNA